MLALAQIDRGRRRARSIDSTDSSPEPSILRAVEQANASSNTIPAASIEEEDEEDVPSSRPTVLLRQPIAFNNDMSLVGSIPTYKYTPPPNTTSGSLSGFIGATSQFGTIPQGAIGFQTQNISGKTGKRKPKPRSRKYTDGFEDQTVVFRVDTPPDPNLLPSNFERLMSFSATTPQNPRRAVTSTPPSVPTATAPQPEQYLSSGSGPYNSLYRIEKPKKPKQAHPPTSSSSSLSASSSSAQASRFLSRSDVSSPLAGTSSAYGATGEDLEVDDGSRILLPPENPPVMKTHYRHNYDKPEAQQSSSPRRKAPVPEPLPGPSTLDDPKFQPKPHRVGRMLTLLIKDVRNEGEVDEQLAEIRVPLRPAGTQAEDGYWADAVQVVEALQEGVSAIEGAAMVYTMRGPYRQVFLRIQEDGSLNYQPTNLVASRERILHVIVDRLPSKGKIPAAPKIPAGVLPAEEEEESGAVRAVADERRKGKGKQVEPIDLTKDDDEVSVSKSKSSRRRRRERSTTSPDDSSSYESRKRKWRKRRKRRRSPSTSSNDDDSDDRSHCRRKRRYDSDDSDRLSRGRKSSRRGNDDSEEDLTQSPGDVQVSARSTISPPPSHKVITLRSPPRLPPEPTLADDPRKVELAIADWIGQKILSHPRYLLHFLRVKGQPPPVPLHKTMLLLHFVKEILDQYTGKHTPPDLKNAPSQLVEQQHVLKGLFLPDDWPDKYLPFLELMSLYGPEGTRCQHPAIVAEMEDMSKAHGNPLERVRKKLLEIDAENSQS